MLSAIISSRLDGLSRAPIEISRASRRSNDKEL